MQFSVCRALGIPCRCVTNYISAHDTNSSLSIDKFYNEDGEEAAEEAASPSASVRSDSVWNFHVWNEVWMTRRDLQGPFGGWQVQLLAKSRVQAMTLEFIGKLEKL